MSSNNRTPASILDPGKRTFEVVHVSGNPNRAQRRHATPRWYRKGVLVNLTMFVPKQYQRPARNVPYVKPVA